VGTLVAGKAPAAQAVTARASAGLKVASTLPRMGYSARVRTGTSVRVLGIIITYRWESRMSEDHGRRPCVS